MAVCVSADLKSYIERLQNSGEEIDSNKIMNEIIYARMDESDKRDLDKRQAKREQERLGTPL